VHERGSGEDDCGVCTCVCLVPSMWTSAGMGCSAPLTYRILTMVKQTANMFSSSSLYGLRTALASLPPPPGLSGSGTLT
jgi:hypothetical protein